MLVSRFILPTSSLGSLRHTWLSLQRSGQESLNTISSRIPAKRLQGSAFGRLASLVELRAAYATVFDGDVFYFVIGDSEACPA